MLPGKKETQIRSLSRHDIPLHVAAVFVPIRSALRYDQLTAGQHPYRTSPRLYASGSTQGARISMDDPALVGSMESIDDGEESSHDGGHIFLECGCPRVG
jgi:hypothetical protein